MPGEMPTTSSNELDISPSTMLTVENTTRKSAKPSDKPITGCTKHILKIFQHPLFDKENHPIKGANTLENLQDNINNNKYDPWWFEFLSRAIDYDHCLFDQSYKIKQSLKCMQNNKNQAIKERDKAIQDRDNAIQKKRTQFKKIQTCKSC